MSDASATERDSAWIALCDVDELPRAGARVFRATCGDIAVFRTIDDHVFALADRCPHKGGPLSQGLVCGHTVTCPLHAWVIALDSGEAQAPDAGRTPRHAVKVDAGRVWLQAARMPEDADAPSARA